MGSRVLQSVVNQSKLLSGISFCMELYLKWFSFVPLGSLCAQNIGLTVYSFVRKKYCEPQVKPDQHCWVCLVFKIDSCTCWVCSIQRLRLCDLQGYCQGGGRVCQNDLDICRFYENGKNEMTRFARFSRKFMLVLTLTILNPPFWIVFCIHPLEGVRARGLGVRG